MATIITKISMITDPEKKGNGYTTIPVMPSTKDRLASLMPKGWDWDRCILELAKMWENQLGKPSKDHQTRRTDP
jgi:hypothetical protein